ncbi:MAG: hypothetical protein JSS54_06415 [Proteobacteria bacterium]|nr:hypothetical protein [Pseudomonadota bacterium]
MVYSVPLMVRGRKFSCFVAHEAPFVEHFHKLPVAVGAAAPPSAEDDICGTRFDPTHRHPGAGRDLGNVQHLHC